MRRAARYLSFRSVYVHVVALGVTSAIAMLACGSDDSTSATSTPPLLPDASHADTSTGGSLDADGSNSDTGTADAKADADTDTDGGTPVVTYTDI